MYELIGILCKFFLSSFVVTVGVSFGLYFSRWLMRDKR